MVLCGLRTLTPLRLAQFVLPALLIEITLLLARYPSSGKVPRIVWGT
jgi:hypothetical protein